MRECVNVLRTKEDCLDTGNTNASSSKCETKRTTEVTITEKPAQEDYIAKQLNSMVSVIGR